MSTTAAFVAAGAGCTVAKHGNRSATGKSGSGRPARGAGRPDRPGADAVADCIRSVGFGFMFAPHHHMAMRHVVPVRKELAVRTIFNFLGPLTNPAGAERQVIGVSEPTYLETIAAALGELGGSARVGSFQRRRARRDQRLRRDPLCRAEGWGDRQLRRDARGAGGRTSARGRHPLRRARRERAHRPRRAGRRDLPERELTLANAGAAIYVGGAADSLADGVTAAREAIDSGNASEAMERYVERTSKLAAV